MKHFRIIFMGTPEFAVPSLLRLIEDGHEIAAVVTQPDRKRGRGGSVSYSAVKKAAVDRGISVLQPERIRRAVDEIADLGAELFVTCAFGQILPKNLLDIPKYGCINVHASLLPKYRGAAPIQRAVMNGDRYTGVTTMMTDAGMDTGDILLKEVIPVPVDMTAGELHDILMDIGAGLLSETLLKLGEGGLEATPQDDDFATYAPMLKKEESIVDWAKSASIIHDKVRALNPWPGCFTKYNGKRMRIIASDYETVPHDKLPGTVAGLGPDGLMVACGLGFLRVLRLQFENGKPMDISQCWHNLDRDAVLGQED